jgi:anaerobic selenocysteine-containing dehydrogenase
MSAENLICCWAMGLTQHKNAVANIQEVINFLLLRGWIGKPGSGACPVRGHSNVQGDRTMGIYEKPAPAFLDSLSREFGFDAPRNHGYDTVDAIKAMHDGKVGVFFALGGNFLSATPDTEYTADALRRCKLTVHVSTKLNRSHLITGETALILPCLGRTEIDRKRSTQTTNVSATGPSPVPTGEGAGGEGSAEQFVTVEDSMSMVHASRGTLPPASPHLLSEPEIVAQLAEAVLGPYVSPLPSEERTGSGEGPGVRASWLALAADYDGIRDHISRVVPGFEDFNARVRQPGGFQLPNAARNREFRTLTGKARFTVHPLPRIDLADGEYLMMTIRSHDQYNTTIYGLDDRYRGIHNGRRVVLMNAADIESAGFKPGAWVDLTCAQAGRVRTAERFLVVPYDIPRRCVATYFPEANAIVPVEIAADKSNTPASKSVIIAITSSTD